MKTTFEGSSAFCKVTRRQEPKRKSADPAPGCELWQRRTRYDEIEKPSASPDLGKLKPKNATPKQTQSQPECINNHIEQFHLPSGENAEKDPSVLQLEIADPKGNMRGSET